MKRAAANRDRPVLGILLKLAAVVLFGGMAACVKYVGQDIPIGEMIFVRGIISLAALALIAWRTAGLQVLRTQNWRSHALRSLAGTGAMFAWFMALTLIPMVEATAVAFTQPMFLSVLATLLLGERMHLVRWTALVVGFTGVSIMVSSHLSFGGSSSLGAAFALASALCGALSMVSLRNMSGRENALSITFYYSLATTVCAALTVFWGWPVPTVKQWVLVALIGVLGTAAQLALTSAYRHAEASALAPLDYTSMIVAMVIGYGIFDEMPARSVWLGVPLVIAAGLLIFWREYRLHKARAD